jgi:hypothetical protein
MTATTQHLPGPQGEHVGSAGLAPQNGVLPVRLRTEFDGEGRPRFTSASLYYALITLKDVVRQSTYYEDIKVVNMSLSAPASHFDPAPMGGVWALNNLIQQDRNKGADRLYIASAGNYDSSDPDFDDHDAVRYPAAAPYVVGVTGYWSGRQWADREKTITNIDEGGAIQGAVFRSDDTLGPWQRAYNLSAIYGFAWYAGGPGGPGYNKILEISYTPNQMQGQPVPYHNFVGTSFAAPQVSALASELYRQKPTATWSDVRQRMWDTGNNLPAAWKLPKRIQFINALNGWAP